MLFKVSLSLFVCMCECVCAMTCLWMGIVGQLEGFSFSPFTKWILGIVLRSSSLATDAFTGWAIVHVPGWVILVVNWMECRVILETNLWSCSWRHFQRCLADAGRPSLMWAASFYDLELCILKNNEKGHEAPAFISPSFSRNRSGITHVTRCFMFLLSYFTRHSGLCPQILKNSSSRKLVFGRYLTQQWEKQPTQLARLECSLLIVSPFCIFCLRHLVHYSFCYHHYPDDSHNSAVLVFQSSRSISPLSGWTLLIDVSRAYQTLLRYFLLFDQKLPPIRVVSHK